MKEIVYSTLITLLVGILVIIGIYFIRSGLTENIPADAIKI